jgi:hypothetical protein
MRAWVIAAAVLAASCAPREAPETQTAAKTETAASTQPGCARSHARQIVFSNPKRPDTLTASSQGPTCGKAIVVLALRTADGVPLWAFASPYTGIAMLAPENGLDSLTAEQMDEFLGQWGNPSTMRAGDLPAWPEEVAALDQVDSGGPTYYTRYPRRFYETARASNRPMFCFTNGWESTQCLIMHPDSTQPLELVEFGV